MASRDDADALASRVDTLRSALDDRRRTEPDALSAAVGDALGSPGVLHGVLLLGAAEVGTPERAADPWLPAALAVEYLDAFARTHERALATAADPDGRRSGPDVLAGDFLYTRAFELLSETSASSATRTACVRTTTAAGRRLCETTARRVELGSGSDAGVDPAAYVDVLDASGGALCRASVVLGARLGDAAEALDDLASFGRDLGVGLTLATAAAVGVRCDDEYVPPALAGDCHETSALAVPRFTARDRSAHARTLRDAAAERFDAASRRLGALPDSRGRALLATLVERVRPAER